MMNEGLENYKYLVEVFVILSYIMNQRIYNMMIGKVWNYFRFPAGKVIKLLQFITGDGAQPHESKSNRH